MRRRFVFSCSGVNDARPIVHWTMPALSVRYCTWPAFAFFTAVHDVGRHRADLRVRHQPARTEDLAQLADDAASRPACAITTSKSMKPSLIFAAEVVEADDVGAGVLRGLRLVALREHGDAHFLPGAGGQHDRAAHRLVRLLRVDAEVDGDVDRLVELRDGGVLDELQRVVDRSTPCCGPPCRGPSSCASTARVAFCSAMITSPLRR